MKAIRLFLTLVGSIALLAPPVFAQVENPPQYITRINGVTPDGNGNVDVPVTWVGAGSPSAGLGRNGDSYLDTAALYWYGPKVSGAWSAGVPFQGPAGATGATGPAGAAGVNTLGSPTSRTMSLATAYQASTSAKPAIVTINLTSTASITLTAGGTNSADIVVGATSAVSAGTGVVVCKYTNSNTGTLTIGLNLSTISASTCTFALPAGYYFAVRQTAGAVAITNAFDQAVG